MKIDRGSNSGRLGSAILGALLLMAMLPAAETALITLFYFDRTGWTEGAAPIAVTLGYYAAPVILLVAAVLAFRAALVFRAKRLWYAVVPIVLLVAYLIASEMVFDAVCTQPLGFPCN